MFKKKKLTATITVGDDQGVRRANGVITDEPLPIELQKLIGVERINITQQGNTIFIAAGNDEHILNIEIKEQ